MFYAGHGIESDGRNYLIPVDAELENELDLAYAAVDVSLVLDRLHDARAAVNLVILDACRDNPLPSRGRSGSRGLARIAAPSGTLVAYAARPGQAAQDGEPGGNGVFTGELLKALGEPGLKVEEVFKRVAVGVRSRTGGSQEAWSEGLITGDFYFVPPRRGAPAAPTAGSPVAPASPPVYDPRITENLFWESVKDSESAADYEAYLAQYPSGAFASLARVRIAALRRSQVSSLPSLAVPAARPVAPGPSIVELDESYVTLKTSNLRSEPTTGGQKVSTIPAGTPVRVTGKLSDGSWYRIAHAGGVAWVWGELVGRPRPAAPVPAQPAAAMLPTPPRHPPAAAGPPATGRGTAGETPQRGGELTFVVGAPIPSYDRHIESTFGMMHPIRPFYSVLVRMNPDNPASTTDIVCDLCVGEVPEPTNGGRTYVFRIRRGVEFHDGTALTARDVKASFDKIVFPPENIASARRAAFSMVDSIGAPDDHTVVFNLKYPSGAFVPALAMPFNFVHHVDGGYVKGERNEKYHHAGMPYLDGYTSFFAPKMSVRLQALRDARADIEFRGFPPQVRDDLVNASGGQIEVQESDWNCALIVTPNHRVRPFDDPRVRRALTLAIDRWSGARYLSRIGIVRAVGGVGFPGHPLSSSPEYLERNIAGYSRDIEASRAEARRLLREAGQANLKFTLNNRGVDQPYKIVGTWLIEQWKQIGVAVDQQIQPTAPFYHTLRTEKDYAVSMDFNCQSVVNPILDVAKFLPSSGSNYANFSDRRLDDMFARMMRSGAPAERKSLMQLFEKRVLDDLASQFVTLWSRRIVLHRSYVKGWTIGPSHYQNQSLENVWIDQAEYRKQRRG